MAGTSLDEKVKKLNEKQENETGESWGEYINNVAGASMKNSGASDAEMSSTGNTSEEFTQHSDNLNPSDYGNELNSKQGEGYKGPKRNTYKQDHANTPEKQGQKDASKVDEEYVEQMMRSTGKSYGEVLKDLDKKNGTNNYKSKLASDIFKSIGNAVAAGLHGAAGKEYENKEGTGIFDMVEKWGKGGFTSKDYDKMKEGRQDIAEKEKDQNYDVNKENRDFNTQIAFKEFEQDQAKDLSNFMAEQGIKTAEDLQNLSNDKQIEMTRKILKKSDVSADEVAKVVKYLGGNTGFDQFMGQLNGVLGAVGNVTGIVASDKKTKSFCTSKGVFK